MRGLFLVDRSQANFDDNRDEGMVFPFRLWHPAFLSMTESLSAILRRHRVNSLIDQARLIRDFPDVDQRIVESRKMIQVLLYDRALGEIDDQEKQRVLENLRFARVPCTIEGLEPLPSYQDEEAEKRIREEEGKDLPKKQQTFFFMP